MAKAKENDDLPQRDRTKVTEKMAERRANDVADPGDIRIPGRPGHPKGWQTGGRDENG
jgi:hypothetical protein